MKNWRNLLFIVYSVAIVLVLSPIVSLGETINLTVTICNGSDCGPTPDITAPIAPSNLVVTAVSSSQINLSWDSSTDPAGAAHEIISGIAGYFIYRNGVVSPIALVSGTSYSDTGLSASTSYFYIVKAFDEADNVSGPTPNIATSTLQAPSSAPNPSQGGPSGTLGTGTTQAALSLNTDIPATCRYGTVANIAYGNLPNIFSATGGTSHTVTVTGLTDGNTYTYYVRCTNSSNIPMTGDYVISFSIAAPVNNGGNGGGGGGGGGGGSGNSPVSPTIPTTVSFQGFAYPNAPVTLLKDGTIIATQPAGPDARFNITVYDLAGGTYTFSVYATDNSGRRSLIHSFTEAITSGVGTSISGIFIPPTIGIDKTQVKQGDPITIFGQSVPKSTVTVAIHSAAQITKNVTPDANGLWKYVLNTISLDKGGHTAAANAGTNTDVSESSSIVNFTVGDSTVIAPSATTTAPVGDVSGDNKVNIIDFSIMSYWYNRPLTSTAAKAADLNHDGKVNLIDFSIMAYHWTG